MLQLFSCAVFSALTHPNFKASTKVVFYFFNDVNAFANIVSISSNKGAKLKNPIWRYFVYVAFSIYYILQSDGHK